MRNRLAGLAEFCTAERLRSNMDPGLVRLRHEFSIARSHLKSAVTNVRKVRMLLKKIDLIEV